MLLVAGLQERTLPELLAALKTGSDEEAKAAGDALVKRGARDAVRTFWQDCVGPPRRRAEDVLLRILAGTDESVGTWEGLTLTLVEGGTAPAKRPDGSPARRLKATIRAENSGTAPVEIAVRRLGVVSVHGEEAPVLAKPEQALKAGPGEGDLEFSTLQAARGGDFRRVYVLTVDVGGVRRTLRTPLFGGD